MTNFDTASVHVPKATPMTMAGHRMKSIFLPPLDHAVADVETILNHIFSMLRDIFSVTRDNVVIVLEESQRVVSVKYDTAGTCQIYVNDDREQVLLESRNWVHLYGDGTKLSNEQIQEIVMCHCRLDLYGDPDMEHIHDDEFDALTEFVQRNFNSRYTFDQTQRRFNVIEI